MNATSEIFRLTRKSYADLIGLARDAAPTLVMALIILAAGDVAGILAARLFASELARPIVATLAAVASFWFAAPYIVHLVRLLLADQLKPELETFTGNLVNARLFAWSGILAFVSATPAYLFSFAPPGITPETVDSPEMITLIWVAFVLVILVWIIYIRTVTMLPDVALGRDITLRQSFIHSRGRFWFLTGAMFLPVIPIFLAEYIFLSGTDGILRIALSVLLSLVMETLALVVSTNLYRWLMDNPK